MAQVIFFSLNYTLGSNGVLALLHKKEELSQIKNLIKQEQLHNEFLKKEIDAWSNNVFLKEKYAREELHMARPEEDIYFIY